LDGADYAEETRLLNEFARKYLGPEFDVQDMDGAAAADAAAAVVHADDFIERYDRLHAAAAPCLGERWEEEEERKSRETGSSPAQQVVEDDAAARPPPPTTTIYLHRNDGEPAILGEGKLLRIDLSAVRPKPFDGVSGGSRMDEVLDRVTKLLELQLYARQLFRPDGASTACFDDCMPARALCSCRVWSPCFGWPV
jgi:hypothetical protein